MPALTLGVLVVAFTSEDDIGPVLLGELVVETAIIGRRLSWSQTSRRRPQGSRQTPPRDKRYEKLHCRSVWVAGFALSGIVIPVTRYHIGRSFGYLDLSGLKERILDDNYIELDDDLCRELTECADSDPATVKNYNDDIMTSELLHEMDTTRAVTYPCSEFLAAACIKDEFDNLCAAAGVRNVGKTTRIKVQPYELKSIFTSLCSKDPQDIHRGKISNILFPHIRYFAYYIARGVLARDNTSNILAPDIAILAAALSGNNTYNIGALIVHCLVANNGKGPHFGGIYATIILEHLEHTVRTDDAPFPFISFDLTAMKRHEFVTRTSDFGNLVCIMRFGEFTTREIRLPAPLLFDYTSRNGWFFTAIELDEFVIQQQFHNPMEGVVPEEEEPSSWEENRTSV
ncbi:hypothetical protein D1007_44474 [Hordeum vulgare]|nr:hypothetical protein D1007_44474 [Hordeum vulgare]